VSKAAALLKLIGRMEYPDFLLVAGDDQTDEGMYSQLPPDAWSIHVGSHSSKAGVSLPDPTEMRALLKELAITSVTR
jgi:trehalose 6-phosphate synthase/phosphatase